MSPMRALPQPGYRRGGPTGCPRGSCGGLMISEYRDWLRSRTSRDGRPFQAETVSAYADAAIALDAWMTAEPIEDDFTVCGTAMLNRFFAAYFASHGQGGTNTKQRNLRHLFTWLQREHDHPHPYTDELQRYAPARTRPSTLAGSSSGTCWRRPGTGGPGTSSTPAITR
jgi:integrase/recombinase XerD